VGAPVPAEGSFFSVLAPLFWVWQWGPHPGWTNPPHQHQPHFWWSTFGWRKPPPLVFPQPPTPNTTPKTTPTTKGFVQCPFRCLFFWNPHSFLKLLFFLSLFLSHWGGPSQQGSCWGSGATRHLFSFFKPNPPPGKLFHKEKKTTWNSRWGPSTHLVSS